MEVIARIPPVCVSMTTTDPDSGELVDLSEEQAEKKKGKLYLAGTDTSLTARADKSSILDDPVFSPRAGLVFQPAEGHALRDWAGWVLTGDPD